MSIRFAPLFVAFTVLAGTVAGCAQTRGETCQVDEDCEGSLQCCKTSTTPSVRGTCEDRCTDVVVDAGTDAGAVETDAGETDAGETDAGEADAGEADAGTDAGETDAGTDAGQTDAGEAGGGA